MTGRRFVLNGWAGACAILASLALCAGEAQPPAPPADQTAKEPAPAAPAKGEAEKEPLLEQVPAVVAPKLSEHEAALHQYVSSAFPDKDGKGGRTYFKNRELKLLSLRQAVLHALEKNLSIKREGKSEEAAKGALREAKAVFDPFFTASVNYNRLEKFDRYQQARRFRRATEPFDVNGNGVIDPGEENILILDKEAQDQSGIFGFAFRDPRPAGTIKDSQRASREGAEGPEAENVYVAKVAQQLPWGNSVSIAYTARRKESYFLQGFRTINRGTREYNLPWSSEISFNVLVPAPFMKDFGRNSGAETQVETARLAKERAFWDTKTVVNSTLLFVDLGYWDVAGTLETLRATQANYDLFQKQFGALAEKLKAGQVTEYAVQQTKVALDGSKAFVENAWNLYNRASASLVNVLDLDPRSVIFPAEYSTYGADEIPVDGEAAYETGLSKRPEIQAERTSKQATEILALFGENQKRPDLKLQIGAAFTQVQTPFGYKSIERSFANSTDPDVIQQSYSVLYNRPWGNRALEAAEKQARLADKQQGLTLRDVTNKIEQEIGDALVGYLASRKQFELSTETLKQAREAQKQAEDLYQAGRLTEFERISKTSDLLSSELEYIAAGVSFKKSEALLLASQGILAAFYAKRSGDRTQMEEIRLERLAQSHQMEFFPTPAEVAAKPKNAKSAKAQPTAERRTIGDSDESAE